MSDSHKKISDFVHERNLNKKLFTAGPASLLAENITGLRPSFGRGDHDYEQVESRVLSILKKMTGHSQIARLQGSASLALEIMTLNFLYGKVLCISTGYYSDRLKWLSESAMRRHGAISQVDTVSWTQLDEVTGNYDWVVACSTETSCGLKLDITLLRKISNKLDAKLMLDATASIGLEDHHEYADVIGYSSCKGLFGLTGACFIAFNDMYTQDIDSFYLNLSTHLEKRMTGPYHTISSLYHVLPSHDEFREAVIINKNRFMTNFSNKLIYKKEQEPKLCTYVDCKITSDDASVILYKPRSDLKGSVVCHLGEVHLRKKASGDIQQLIYIDNDNKL